jgi:hypothetical protein
VTIINFLISEGRDEANFGLGDNQQSRSNRFNGMDKLMIVMMIGD